MDLSILKRIVFLFISCGGIMNSFEHCVKQNKYEQNLQ